MRTAPRFALSLSVGVYVEMETRRKLRRFRPILMQIGGRIFRHAAEFPHFHRAAKGILHDIFRQREVLHAEDPRQGGDHPPCFAPKEKIARFHGFSVCYMFIFSSGRTSTEPPTSRIGQPFESSTDRKSTRLNSSHTVI